MKKGWKNCVWKTFAGIGLLAGLLFWSFETQLMTAEAAWVIASGEVNEDYGQIVWEVDSEGKLTVTGTGNVSLDDSGRRAPWFSYREEIKTAELAVSGMTDASYLFFDCKNMRMVDLSDFDTSNVTNMYGMFWHCESLEELDLSSFDTSKVTDMEYMFSYCDSLMELDLSSFDMGNVTVGDSSIYFCDSLEKIIAPLNCFIEVSLPYESGYGWYILDGAGYKNRYLPRYLTESVVLIRKETTEGECRAGGVIDESYGQIVWEIDSAGKLTVTGTGDVTVRTNRERTPWYLYREEIVSAEINVTGMTDASYMFFDCRRLKKLDLGSFDTKNVTNMNGMFEQCSSLMKLDVSSFDTKNVTNMSHMFDSCSSLTELDVSSFDTKNVTNMSYMFDSCKSLTELDLSNFNTHNVTNMSYMFAGYVLVMDKGWIDESRSGNALKKLDLSGFDTKNVTSMSSMFSRCKLLEELDLSGFDTKKVTNMNCMFERCSSLTKLDLSSFDTSNVTDMTSIFHECNSLQRIHAPRNCRISNAALPYSYDGYVWYTKEGTIVTELPRELEKSTVLIVRKELDSETDLKESVINIFSDVHNDWYTDYIQFAYYNQLMTGIEGTALFQPNHNISKAQVAQVLHNIEGNPWTSDRKVFSELTDVYEKEWFANAVAWAYNNGIVTGDMNTKKFNPNAAVTREQLALMLYRYAEYKGYCTVQKNDLAGLKNRGSVSDWANEGVRWAVGTGLISGIEASGTKDLAPQGNATRAQVAAVLVRYFDEYNTLIPRSVFEWGGHKYAIFDNCMSWEDAKEYCEFREGHLASISSQEENTALYSYIKKCGLESAYFGLSDSEKEGNWKWSTDEEVTYTNWNSEEPSGGDTENYAMFFYLYKDGTWNDGAFKENIYDGGNAFICEWN